MNEIKKPYNKWEKGFVPIFFVIFLLAAIFLGTSATIVAYTSSKTDKSFLDWVMGSFQQKDEQRNANDINTYNTQTHKLTPQPTSSNPNTIFADPNKISSLRFNLASLDTYEKTLGTIKYIGGKTMELAGYVPLSINGDTIKLYFFEGTVNIETGVVIAHGKGELTKAVNTPSKTGTAHTSYAVTMTGMVGRNLRASGDFILTATLDKTTGDIPFIPKEDTATIHWQGHFE